MHRVVDCAPHHNHWKVVCVVISKQGESLLADEEDQGHVDTGKLKKIRENVRFLLENITLGDILFTSIPAAATSCTPTVRSMQKQHFSVWHIWKALCL